MLAAMLGCGLVFLSICMQVYYYFHRSKMQSSKRISAICKVIILRTIGFVLCVIAMITSYSSVYVSVAFAIALALLIYDVWRLKLQIDEMVK